MKQEVAKRLLPLKEIATSMNFSSLQKSPELTVSSFDIGVSSPPSLMSQSEAFHYHEDAQVDENGPGKQTPTAQGSVNTYSLEPRPRPNPSNLRRQRYYWYRHCTETRVPIQTRGLLRQSGSNSRSSALSRRTSLEDVQALRRKATKA